MFRTNIRSMECAAEDMKSQIRKLGQEIDEIRSVMNCLSDLSGMDSVRYQLRKESEKLELQRSNLMKLMVVLQQSARSYAICENDNINHAENYKRQSGNAFDWIQIPPIPYISVMM